MNVTLMERLDFQIFFDIITVAIDALLHVLWHFSYTLVTELSSHIVQVQGSICTAREQSHTNLQAFLAPLLQLFQPKPKAYQNAVRHGLLYISDPLLHIFDVHTLWHIDSA